MVMKVANHQSFIPFYVLFDTISKLCQIKEVFQKKGFGRVWIERGLTHLEDLFLYISSCSSSSLLLFTANLGFYGTGWAERKKANSKGGGVKSVQITIQQISGNPARPKHASSYLQGENIQFGGRENFDNVLNSP